MFSLAAVITGKLVNELDGAIVGLEDVRAYSAAAWWDGWPIPTLTFMKDRRRKVESGGGGLGDVAGINVR